MCTLTFVPVNDGVIITHNRDEKPRRVGLPSFATRIINGVVVRAPIDPTGGGTWFGFGDDGTVAAILNRGNNIKALHSRGSLVCAMFSYDTVEEFASNHDVSSMGPFVMPVYRGGRFYVVNWDGRGIEFSELVIGDPKIFSSPTLYNGYMSRKREEWFEAWLLDHPNPTQSDILELHRRSQHPEYGYVMKRAKEATLSIMSVGVYADSVHFVYDNLALESEGSICLQTT